MECDKLDQKIASHVDLQPTFLHKHERRKTNTLQKQEMKATNGKMLRHFNHYELILHQYSTINAEPIDKPNSVKVLQYTSSEHEAN